MVHMAIFSAALANQTRDIMGTVLAPEPADVSRQHIASKLCLKGLACDTGPSASISLLMQGRVITKPLYVLLSAVTDKQKIEIKSHRAIGTGNRITQMTHTQVILTLITLIKLLKGRLGLNSLGHLFFLLSRALSSVREKGASSTSTRLKCL